MLNVQTINCMQYSEPVVIQTRSQSRNEINTHKENLVQKHNKILKLKKSYLVLNEEKEKRRKQEWKTSRIITLDSENSKKIEWQHSWKHDIGLRNFV